MKFQATPANALKVLSVLSLFACGTSHKGSVDVAGQSASSTKTTKVFALSSDIPECTSDLEAQPIYVVETKSYKICQNGQWEGADKPSDFTAPADQPQATTTATNDQGSASVPEAPAATVATSDQPASEPKPLEPEYVEVSANEFTVCVHALPDSWFQGATRFHVTRYDVPGPTPYTSANFTIDGGDHPGHYSYGTFSTMTTWDNLTAKAELLSGYKLFQAACPVD